MVERAADMRMRFIDELKMGVDALDQGKLWEPNRPVPKGARIIGSIESDLWLKKIYQLAKQYRLRASQIGLEAHFQHDEVPKHSAEAKKIAELSSKADTLINLFWTETKQYFGEDSQVWTEDEIGIYAGWTIVCSKATRKHPLEGIIGMIGGSE